MSNFVTLSCLPGLDTDFHNQQVLFPSVTVCPLSSFDPASVNETAQKNMPNDEDNFEELVPVFQSLPQMTYLSLEEKCCVRHYFVFCLFRYDTFGGTYEAVLNMTSDFDAKIFNLRQLAFAVGIKCEDLLEICKYKDEEISCCEYFNPIYSEQGLCYSFNARYYGTPTGE